MIEEALQSLIVSDSAVSAITARCYPVTIPQGPEYPLILYTKISGPRVHSLGGPSGMAMPRYQIEAWAESYAEAKTLADAIREALDGYRGTVLGVRIGSILIESERDGYESDVSIYRVIQDYNVIHDE